MADLIRYSELESAIGIATDRSMDINDRAAMYSALRNLKLHIERALRPVTTELTEYMVQREIRALGPLSIKSTAVDPRYVCNDEGNWTDADVQDQLAKWFDSPRYNAFIKRVPAHFEVDTARLAKGFAESDPAAGDLVRECKTNGFRVETGRRASLAVAEPKKEKAA